MEIIKQHATNNVWKIIKKNKIFRKRLTVCPNLPRRRAICKITSKLSIPSSNKEKPSNFSNNSVRWITPTSKKWHNSTTSSWNWQDKPLRNSRKNLPPSSPNFPLVKKSTPKCSLTPTQLQLPPPMLHLHKLIILMFLLPLVKLLGQLFLRRPGGPVKRRWESAIPKIKQKIQWKTLLWVLWTKTKMTGALWLKREALPNLNLPMSSIKEVT